jgi:hypothetical protein
MIRASVEPYVDFGRVRTLQASTEVCRHGAPRAREEAGIDGVRQVEDFSKPGCARSEQRAAASSPLEFGKQAATLAPPDILAGPPHHKQH